MLFQKHSQLCIYFWVVVKFLGVKDLFGQFAILCILKFYLLGLNGPYESPRKRLTFIFIFLTTPEWDLGRDPYILHFCVGAQRNALLYNECKEVQVKNSSLVHRKKEIYQWEQVPKVLKYVCHCSRKGIMLLLSMLATWLLFWFLKAIIGTELYGWENMAHRTEDQ